MPQRCKGIAMQEVWQSLNCFVVVWFSCLISTGRRVEALNPWETYDMRSQRAPMLPHPYFSIFPPAAKRPPAGPIAPFFAPAQRPHRNGLKSESLPSLPADAIPRPIAAFVLFGFDLDLLKLSLYSLSAKSAGMHGRPLSQGCTTRQELQCFCRWNCFLPAARQGWKRP